MYFPQDVADFLDSSRKGGNNMLNEGHTVWTLFEDGTPRYEIMGRKLAGIFYYRDAQGGYEQTLCLEEEAGGRLGHKFYLVEGAGYTFYAFSLCELLHKREVMQLADALREGIRDDFEAVLRQYDGCPGSQYWLANAITTSTFDPNYSEARNALAHDVYHRIAGLGDPRGCSEMAAYYFFTNGSPEEVIRWRQEAVRHGYYQDLKELADFIIEYYPQKIGLALEALEKMQEIGFQPDWARRKAGTIYMKGIGIPPDPSRGVDLIRRAAEGGSYTAKADLAFFYYQGIGVERNVEKALDLLTEANEASKRSFSSPGPGLKEETGEPEGMWDEFISKLKRELGRN